MQRNARTVRAAVVGMTTALFLVSGLIVAACGFRITAPDFPVLKLSSSSAEPAASAEPAPPPAQ